MNNDKLDQEELEILEAFNSGRLKSVPNLRDELKKHKMYAANTLKSEQTQIQLFRKFKIVHS